MSKRTGQIRLGAFVWGTGHHVASWRHPDVPADAATNIEHYRNLARLAEGALFDAIFIADNVAAETGPAAARSAGSVRFEPLTLMSNLAATTKNLGLISTVTTTYNEPYHVARKFASLDLLSGGRSGWNLVTSDNALEAGNFGRDEHVAHADRYERAAEFHDVVTGLWDSWEREAFIRDKASGLFFDESKLHVLNHRGKHFSVRGPLNAPRSAQGRPVVVQAGSSEAGRELAARTAEVVFTAQPDLPAARSFYKDLKGRLSKYGRNPDSLKIMPGVFVVVGKTESEARDKHEYLQSLVDPVVGLGLLSRMIGNFDLSRFPLDGPLPELPLTETGQRSRQQLFTELARRESLTIRQLYLRIAGGRGHFSIVGNAAQVADQLQSWFEEDGADGFNVMPPYLPGAFADFAELVVPELQRRGLFRTSYESSTLRGNLGLPLPVSRFAKEF
jgi:FMN-dependent oxidoreductase (nitrilotriacetate monooxygenase family)